MKWRNKYLKELGILDDVWFLKDTDDKRYKYDEDGFVPAETWNLDYTLACIIYSYLCYFRDHESMISTPGKFDTVEEWQEVLDKMIYGFKLYITKEKDDKTTAEELFKSFDLFEDYFPDLWS